MSDVNGFLDAIGKDVTETVVPKIEGLANQIGTKTLDTYGPRISAFASQLVKEIVDEQSATIRDFVVGAIQDLFQRYHPELVGELQTTIVRDGLQVTGQNIRLDLKRRDTGVSISSLEIPVSLVFKVPELAVSLQNTTIKLDVIK